MLRRSLLALSTLGFFTSPVLATWSIVVIDHGTREVCIAGATCVENINLRRVLSVIRVGKGAGASQSSIDGGFEARQLMWQGFLAGDTPQEILDTIIAANVDFADSRQYGIVSFDGPPVKHSAGGVAHAKHGIAGQAGDLAYAIQGNVLTGDEVIIAAEDALLRTAGDLGQRVMAAMQAARSFGGDGRCSCDPWLPTDCGSPPPAFDKTAHCSFIMLARLGDSDGACPGVGGCSGGEYYLKRQVRGDRHDLDDPVERLQRKYNRWREGRRLEPDHFLTQVTVAAPRLVADDVTSVDVTIRSVNLDGVPLTTGGLGVQVVQTSPGPAVATPGAVVDHGDGTYTFPLTATATPGSGTWQIVMQTASREIWLRPELSIEVDPLTELHAGYPQVSATPGADVPLVVNRGGADAGRGYLILASASGTSPGVFFGGQPIPLNPDGLLRFTALRPGPPRFPGSSGQLDAAGRAQATLHALPGALFPFVGRRLDFLAVLAGPPDDLTTVAGFDVVP